MANCTIIIESLAWKIYQVNKISFP